jgi:predicted component of type VI protein secretion system
MPAKRLEWSSLLHMTELDFEPEAPSVLSVTDELSQSLSWLTAATGHDRKLIRCNELGAILVSNSWDNLSEVETDELAITAGMPDTFTATVENKGVLVASSTEIVKLDFVRVSGGDVETIYIPPNWLYFYPHKTYSITATVVPAATGDASYIGITAFN